MITGKHLIADVFNFINYELLYTIDCIKPLMEIVIKDLQLNIVGQKGHQFQPIGATSLHLSSESHTSIHTYSELRCYAAVVIELIWMML